jgi:hypothetical protein
MTYTPIKGVPPSRNPTHPRYRPPEDAIAMKTMTRMFRRLRKIPAERENAKGLKLATFADGSHYLELRTGWRRCDKDGNQLVRNR